MPEPKQGPASAAPAAEPLAAILADYRADIPAMTSGELPHPTPEYLRILLDRIEAAAERERDEARRLDAIRESDEAFARCARCDRPERATGNAAAMRAALERCNEFFRCDDDNKLRLCTLARKADEATQAALAAPARNCDRFATEDEAREAYWAYREPLEFNGRPFVAITEWLFDKAEGGAK